MFQYMLLGFRIFQSKNKKDIVILNFLPNDDDKWEGTPGNTIFCMRDNVIGDLQIGETYKVVSNRGSNFASAVIKI